jgi:hypothetical protein
MPRFKLGDGKNRGTRQYLHGTVKEQHDAANEEEASCPSQHHELASSASLLSSIEFPPTAGAESDPDFCNHVSWRNLAQPPGGKLTLRVG